MSERNVRKIEKIWRRNAAAKKVPKSSTSTKTRFSAIHFGNLNGIWKSPEWPSMKNLTVHSALLKTLQNVTMLIFYMNENKQYLKWSNIVCILLYGDMLARCIHS